MRDLLHFGQSEAAAITGTDERTHTRACDDPDWNSFFFEDFQNADVSDASSKAPAQGDPYPRRPKLELGKFRTAR
jgi:hypothetical protein